MGAVRAGLIVAAVMAFFHAVPAADTTPRAYGRELVAQHQLPADAVARYATRAAAAVHGDTSAERTVPVDPAPWVGPLQQAGAGRNPYTLVLTVSGLAKAPGDVRTQWQAGWEVRESPVATREVQMQVTGQANAVAAAGVPVSLTAIGMPVSFRGERQVAPMLDLVNAHNMDITDVRLQVWSGSPPMVAWPVLSAANPALLGLGALCLLAWLFLKFATRPAAGAVGLVSAPRVDVPLLLEGPHSAGPSTTPALLAAPPAATPTAAPIATPIAAQVSAPPQNQASRVVTALRDVLTIGLAVPTELDNTRRRRRAAKA